MTNRYFDYAAATPTDDRVVEAMQPYYSQQFYNPSAVYLASRDLKLTLENFRADFAHWLGARPSEITFTAGASEANNLAITGVMRAYPDANVLVSGVEHESVIEPAAQYKHKLIPVNKHGQVEKSSLAKLIDEKTALVSIMYANNEVGTVQHLAEITEVIEDVRHHRKATGNDLPLFFHTDASQASNYLDLHVNKLGVDLMTLSGSKMYGPKQTGALYIRAGITLEPLIYGGGQEHGLRSGTENIAQVAGFAKSLKIAQAMRKEEVYRLTELRRLLLAGLEKLPYKIQVLGHKKQVLPNIVAFQIDNLDGERAVMALDERGIQCATGSACAALSDESSHVVKSLGFTDEQARGTIRLSMGRNTSKQDVESALSAIKEVLELSNTWNSR